MDDNSTAPNPTSNNDSYSTKTFSNDRFNAIVDVFDALASQLPNAAIDTLSNETENQFIAALNTLKQLIIEGE